MNTISVFLSTAIVLTDWHVKEFSIWALFTQKTVDGHTLYDDSLRSKQQYQYSANKYHGGGRRMPPGVKDLTENVTKFTTRFI